MIGLTIVLSFKRITNRDCYNPSNPNLWKTGSIIIPKGTAVWIYGLNIQDDLIPDQILENLTFSDQLCFSFPYQNLGRT